MVWRPRYASSCRQKCRSTAYNHFVPLFPPYQLSSLPCTHNTSAAGLSWSADTIRQCVPSKRPRLSRRTGAWVIS
eukprot:3435933-Rhodomonas_salina.2